MRPDRRILDLFGIELPILQAALAPLHALAQARGPGDFSPMFAGQAAPLGRKLPASELTRVLAAEMLDLLWRMTP